MAPVRTQNDQCESVAFLSTTKRLLHIGKRIYRWLEQSAIWVRFSDTGTSNKKA